MILTFFGKADGLINQGKYMERLPAKKSRRVISCFFFEALVLCCIYLWCKFIIQIPTLYLKIKWQNLELPSAFKGGSARGQNGDLSFTWKRVMKVPKKMGYEKRWSLRCFTQCVWGKMAIYPITVIASSAYHYVIKGGWPRLPRMELLALWQVLVSWQPVVVGTGGIDLVNWWDATALPMRLLCASLHRQSGFKSLWGQSFLAMRDWEAEE